MGFPNSFEVFSSNSNRSSDDIPVIFDLFGTESSIIPSALSRCLKLKKGSILKRKSKKKISNLPKDFIYTWALCSLSENFLYKKRARIFMLIRNPFTTSVLSFEQKQDIKGPEFDERFLGLNLRDYIESTLPEKDSLIRSILCKEKSDITEEDYAAAQFFMDNYTTFGIYHQDHMSNFLKILETFEWKLQSKTAQKCVDTVFKRDLLQTHKYYAETGNMIDFYDTLKDVNKYDTKLYTHALSQG